MKHASLCLCASLAFLLLFTGCNYQIPLNNRQLVQAIGIDYEDGVYLATMQVSKVNEQEDTQVQVFQAKGSSTMDALNRITMTKGNRPLYSHSLLIVFGRACAEDGLDNAVDFFVRSPESNFSVDIMMADERAADILLMKSDGLYISARDIKALADAGQYNGRVAQVRLVDLINRFRGEGTAAYLPVIKADKGKPVMDGTAIFNGGKLKNVLTSGKTRAMLLMMGKVKGGAEVLEVPDVGKVTFELYKTKSKIKPRIENGKPVFEIKISCDVLLNALDVPSGKELGADTYPLFERLLAEQMKENCEETIKICIEDSRSDVFNFGKHLLQGQTDYWKAHSTEWMTLMAESKYDVTVEAKVKRSGQELTPQLP